MLRLVLFFGLFKLFDRQFLPQRHSGAEYVGKDVSKAA
jgi:hypothetical protein